MSSQDVVTKEKRKAETVLAGDAKRTAQAQSAPESTLPSALANTIKKEENVVDQKQEAMSAAVQKFKDISASLGGHEQAKAFFDTYGTDGFKPDAPPAERELIKPQELKLDSDLKDYSGSKLGMPTRPDKFGASYLEEKWDIEKPSDLTKATDLKDDEWADVIETTKMLHGYVINPASGLSRARFQAFQLKAPAGASYTDASTVKPDFEVFDASGIFIKETKSQVERSMAANGFSSSAISASVSVSTPYVGVGASASYSSESQKSQNKGDFADRQEYTATYNFPRARVFLDELNLEVTPACAKFLVDIQNASKAIKKNIDSGASADAGGAVSKASRLIGQFFARFGHVFACTVQLGGQLTASKSASSFASTSESQKRDAMQAAAAVSVESKFVSASASYSKGKSDEIQTNAANVDSSSALAWNARGGNTLLCANPAQWADSVADHTTWRVMEQENVELLPELISRLTRPTDDGAPAWPGIAKMFATIAENKFKEIPPVPPGTWTGQIQLETNKGQKIVFRDGQLCVSNDPVGTTFSVLDADMKRRDETDPQMDQFYADHPVFLMPSHQYSRQSQAQGAQFAGLSVDPGNAGGNITSGRVARWSFRPGTALPSSTNGILAPWTPDKHVIRHNDEIGLFCHSYYAGGSFTTTNNPPYFAPWVVKKDNEDALRVWKLDPDFLAGNKIHQTVKSNVNWAFIFPDRASIQDLVARSDTLMASPHEENQVEVYRKLFGLSSNLANWTSNYDDLLGDGAVYLRAKLGEAWYNLAKAQIVADYIPKELPAGMMKWAEANGFIEETPVRRAKLEPLRLRVKFVYEKKVDDEDKTQAVDDDEDESMMSGLFDQR